MSGLGDQRRCQRTSTRPLVDHDGDDDDGDDDDDDDDDDDGDDDDGVF